MKTLTYSVVIATRNRPEALSLSIPRMLEQCRRPSQLIVVDSSDDHASVLDAVKEAIGDDEIDLKVIQAERGLTRQRNQGLALVSHPITFFPDDDSIWFPGAAKKQMEIYDHDEKEEIAGVCPAESSTPPPGFLDDIADAYQMKFEDRLRQKIVSVRAMIENRLFPDPLVMIGHAFCRSFASPKWLESYNVSAVAYMTGFRMSFRTDVIREISFDEAFQNYSLNEDVDVSLGAWKHGGVVGVHEAQVYHYKSPERRDNGYTLGLQSMLNRAYLVAKHTELDSEARKKLLPFVRFKTTQYALVARDSFGKERLAGAKASLKGVKRLMNTTPEQATDVYCDEVSA